MFSLWFSEKPTPLTCIERTRYLYLWIYLVSVLSIYWARVLLLRLFLREWYNPAWNIGSFPYFHLLFIPFQHMFLWKTRKVALVEIWRVKFCKRTVSKWRQKCPFGNLVIEENKFRNNRVALKPIFAYQTQL